MTIASEHPVGGNKARVLKSALGLTQEHADELRLHILDNLGHWEATEKATDQYGTRYEVEFNYTGPNGRVSVLTSAWIYRVGEDFPRLTSLYIADKNLKPENHGSV
jgi:filamentous hemagglutinin